MPPCSNADQLPIGGQYPTTCCFTNGDSCCEYYVANNQDDFDVAELLCAALGGCWTGWVFGPGWRDCEQFGCPDSALRSCCDLLTGDCTTEGGGSCNGVTQLATCPHGGSLGGPCDPDAATDCATLASTLHACCLDPVGGEWGGMCFVTNYASCEAAGGEFHWWEDECVETICSVGCRDNVEPFTPTTAAPGEEWGTKTYTLDLCYPAPMVRVRPPQAHGNSARRGRGVPMTEFEVRNVAQAQETGSETDPCARAYGVLARDENGRRRPYLCSQTDPNVATSATLSQGYFSKALDNSGGVLQGRRVRRAGVMTEPHREVRYEFKQLVCSTPLP